MRVKVSHVYGVGYVPSEESLDPVGVDYVPDAPSHLRGPAALHPRLHYLCGYLPTTMQRFRQALVHLTSLRAKVGSALVRIWHT